MRLMLFASLLALASCASPDHLPIPQGVATPINTSVPPIYAGNGFPPVLGGIDPAQ